MKGVYEFAGMRIEVDSLHGMVYRDCAAYRSSGDPDLSIALTQGDIDFERTRVAEEDGAHGREHIEHTDPFLEFIATYRRIAELAPALGRMVMHGSAVAVDGEGYLFCAPSGTGKSTHASLWSELLGERFVMVNDDKPLVSVETGRVFVHGSPWSGKRRLDAPVSVPLKAVCFLEQASGNVIRELDAAEAYPMLVRQTYRPVDPGMLATTLRLIDELAATVGLYKLDCTIDIEAARLAYQTMKG